MGRLAMESQGARWIERYRGRYVAITLSGQPIANCASLEDLYDVLAMMNPKEDYYVARVGYPTIGQLR